MRKLITSSEGRLLIVFVVLIALALVIPFIMSIFGLDSSRQNIGNRLAQPSFDHPLGTDEFGRDMLARILLGLRGTLFVCVLAVLIAGIIGCALGLISGYFQNWFSTLITTLADALVAIPILIIALLTSLVIGRSLFSLTVGVAVGLLPRFIRLAHSLALSIRGRDFLTAERVLGSGNGRILFRHVLPNVKDDLTAAAATWLASAVLLESGLTFLGLGPGIPTPTLGGLIKGGLNYISTQPLLALAPAGVLLILMLLVQFFRGGAGPGRRTRGRMRPRETVGGGQLVSE